MLRPAGVKLSRENDEALLERLENNAWTAAERRVVVQVLRVYCWLFFAVQDTKISLKWLRAM